MDERDLQSPVENRTQKKAVIFPGMGYHTDKPLLYYGKKLLIQKGYEITDLKYPSLPGDTARAFQLASEAVLPVLKSADWSDCSDIVLLSKSIGTIIAGQFTAYLKGCTTARIRNIFCTPVPETLPYICGDCVVFHGLADPRMDSDTLISCCRNRKIPLFTYPEANHSIETPDVIRNTDIIRDIVRKYDAFLRAD